VGFNGESIEAKVEKQDLSLKPEFELGPSFSLWLDADLEEKSIFDERRSGR